MSIMFHVGRPSHIPANSTIYLDVQVTGGVALPPVATLAQRQSILDCIANRPIVQN